MEVEKRIVAFFSGVFATFIQLYGFIFGMTAIVVMMDYVTGIVSAKANGKKITSKKATRGFWKKIGLFLALFFGVMLDAFIPYSLKLVNIELPFRLPFGMIFGCYIVFNEAISITENLYAINPNMLPKWVQKLLQGAINKIDEKGEDENEDT